MAVDEAMIRKAQEAMDRHLKEYQEKHQTELNNAFWALTPENKALVNTLIGKVFRSQELEHDAGTP